jgi:hypothetical protein
MSTKATHQPTIEHKSTQTPFERFKAAASKVPSIQKSSIRTPQKKSGR